MIQSAFVPVVVSGATIAFLLWLLAATRKSLSSEELNSQAPYPSPYWMGIGISGGIAFGLLLGVMVRSMTGAISIGIGLGLLLGNYLHRRNQPLLPQATEQHKEQRLRRASWRVIIMILLILASLAAAFLSPLR